MMRRRRELFLFNYYYYYYIIIIITKDEIRLTPLFPTILFINFRYFINGPDVHLVLTTGPLPPPLEPITANIAVGRPPVLSVGAHLEAHDANEGVCTERGFF